jgi:hypothetical protein
VNSKAIATAAIAAGLTIISSTPSSALVTSVEFVPSAVCPGTDTTWFVNGQSTGMAAVEAGYWMKETRDGVVSYLDGIGVHIDAGLYTYTELASWPLTIGYAIEIYQGDPREPGSTLVASDALTISATCPPEEESNDSEPLAATGGNQALGGWLPALGLATVLIGTIRFWRRKRSG